MDATRTTPLRERMRQELQLAGISERTQEAYLRAVHQARHPCCPLPAALQRRAVRLLAFLPRALTRETSGTVTQTRVRVRARICARAS
jgi:hypothetical protein